MLAHEFGVIPLIQTIQPQLYVELLEVTRRAYDNVLCDYD